MTEQQIAAALRAHLGPPPVLDADAETRLAAALLGGDADARESGLDLLARMPQGPQLARVMAALAPDAATLATGLAAQRRPRVAGRRAAFGAVLALAASAAAVAVLVGGLRGGPVDPVPGPVADDRILVASFEDDGHDHATRPAAGPGRIFSADFDS